MSTTVKSNKPRLPLSSALATIAAFVSVIPLAHAAVTEAWVRRYNHGTGGGADDSAVKVVHDDAGDIIVTGGTRDAEGSDIVTIKYSGTTGSLLWKKRYTGPAGWDYPTDLAVDDSRNVIVAGASLNGASYELYTAKYAATDGALLWERRHHSPTTRYEGRGLALDRSGNVVVAGVASSTDFFDSRDYYTMKYAAADGTLLWERRYNGPANAEDELCAVAIDISGNVVVTGYSRNETNSDYYTAKYAGVDGALLWEKRYNSVTNSHDLACALAVDRGGNAIVTGYSQGFGLFADIYTAKYAAADGALLWEKHSEGVGQGVAVDSDGNIIVIGDSYISRHGPDYYVAKYAAADGRLLWERRYDGPGGNDDEAKALAIDGSGNVVVTGSSDNRIQFYGADYYTAKYAAADGALLWEKRYNGPTDGPDHAEAVTADGMGNVIVTGTIDLQLNPDFYTAKYAAADGALLWEKRYDGPVTTYDGAVAVAVDGNGNVVVTGNSATIKYLASGTAVWTNAGATALAVDDSGDVIVTPYSDTFQYYTAKYAGADGALLWEQTHNGPTLGWNYPPAMALDASGNVAVTGSSYDTNFNYDYYTAKYTAADGALLWERRHSSSEGYNVVADGSGNVVVTGFPFNRTNDDYYMAKYAAADGALLWEKPTTNGYAKAVAVDGNGNVVATGSSSSGYDTAKYSAANGALLWETRYENLGGIGMGAAWRAAVDGNGNVIAAGNTHNGTNYNYYAAKYAAADGALLWEKSSSGQDDRFVAAVAVDGDGNLVVTGSSGGDYYTAKYAATDGALLWEKLYDGPANGGDHATAVAVAVDGSVVVTGTSGGEYATVVYREVPELSISLTPAGVRLRVTLASSRSHQIERAPALSGPWSVIASAGPAVSGVIEYVDAVPPVGAAFYRVVQP